MPNYVADNNNNTLNNASLLTHSRFLSPIYNAHESPIDEGAAIAGEHMQLSNGLSREDGNPTGVNSLLSNSHHTSSVSPLNNCQQQQMSYVDHLNEVKLEKQSTIDDLSLNAGKLNHPLGDSQQTAKVKLEPHSDASTVNMEQSIDYLDF